MILHAGELKAIKRSGLIWRILRIWSIWSELVTSIADQSKFVALDTASIPIWSRPKSEAIVGKPYLLDQLKEIRGKINPIELSLDSMFGRDWTLVLEDGRKLDFFITETITGTIIPTTGFRL